MHDCLWNNEKFARFLAQRLLLRIPRWRNFVVWCGLQEVHDPIVLWNKLESKTMQTHSISFISKNFKVNCKSDHWPSTTCKDFKGGEELEKMGGSRLPFGRLAVQWDAADLWGRCSRYGAGAMVPCSRCGRQPLRMLSITMTRKPWNYETMKLRNIMFKCMSQIGITRGWFLTLGVRSGNESLRKQLSCETFERLEVWSWMKMRLLGNCNDSSPKQNLHNWKSNLEAFHTNLFQPAFREQTWNKSGTRFDKACECRGLMRAIMAIKERN